MSVESRPGAGSTFSFTVAFEKQLSAWGIRTTAVEGGPEALKELRSAGKPYELAVLDMQMPGMDGRELAGRIKADPDLARVRLVLLTSMGRRGEEAGRSG